MTGQPSPLAQRFAKVLRNAPFVDRHLAALRFKKERRDATITQIADWDARRSRAAALKAQVRAQHEQLLDSWVERAQAAGTKVYRAADAAEANAIILEIAQEHGVRSIAKSKSMTTEECGLNAFLAQHGIEVTDTDLGERIVQLFGETPSHLVTPAIHRSRQEIGELFAREGLCEAGEDDPTRLTQAARRALRQLFLTAELGLTGGNFLVAETGSLVVVENEANSLLGTSLPHVHVALVGIEKLIPELQDLATFLTVLAPSSTGQRLTTYTTHYRGPQARSRDEEERGLPPRELHVVLLDNGRRALRGTPAEEALACIRCGACLNVCPVFRRVGGHAYDWVYMGPIGAILAPGLASAGAAAAADAQRHDDLVKASTLCAACNDVCPVRIDIAGHLHDWRGELRSARRLPASLPPMAGRLLAHPRLWRAAIGTARRLGPLSGFVVKRSKATRAWQAGGARALPELPAQSFSQWWKQRGASGPQALRLERASGLSREGSEGPPAAQTAALSDLSEDELEALFRRALSEAGGESPEPGQALDVLIPQDAVVTALAQRLLQEHGLERRLAPVEKAALDGTDCLVATARSRVADKGSCWVDFGDLASRAQLLLSERLILLVPRAALFRDLDEFYAQLAREDLSRCAAHVTGPSKTADIEQTLVFGAHGPRSLLVLPF